MGKLLPTRKRVIFMVLMVLAGSVFTLVYLAFSGNESQIYNDIIVEWTSMFSSNKSAEKNLLFLLIFAGIVIYSVYYLINRKRWKDVEGAVLDAQLNESLKAKECICVLIAVAGVYFLIFNGTYQIVMASLIFVTVLFVVDKDLIFTGICVFYLGVYAYAGLYRFYVFAGGQNNSNNMMAAMAVLFVSLIPLISVDKKRVFICLGMVEGVLIPLSLLVYLSNKYKNGEDIITINIPIAAKALVAIIITGFLAEALFIIVKKWKKAEGMDEVISMGSCVSIMAFNCFSGTGAIMPADMHHPFENIIGYSQVFKLGQKFFSEYIPVSGMYSVVQGAVFDWFGEGGTLANYYVTENLFYLLVIILIVAFLKKQVDSSRVLLISLVFYVLKYNRLVFMLPIMLLLSWQKLIANKNLWLQVWFLSSLFQGLYYPLYGAATCAAFIPLGIWQTVNYVRSGELRKAVKTPKFWGGWGSCMLFLVLSMKYLLGTFKHMLAMSGQSILADGISRFGQLVPGWFFSYLGDNYPIIRIGLYDVFSFMIPAAFVWIAFSMAVKVADISFDGKKVRVGNIKNASIVISTAIMPVVCYTFTFIRLDIDSIYARSTGVLYAGVVLLLIFTWKFVSNKNLRLLLIIVLVAIPGVVNGIGVFSTESSSKLMAYYTVPDGYTYIENDAVEKLGTGFMEQGCYEGIKNVYKRFAKKDRRASYMGDPSWFGYYYLLDIKGDGPMELGTVKSYSAVEETVNVARANQSIIAPSFTPFHNYYLYHWLLASGEYVWDADAGEFFPNDGRYTKEEIIGQNKNIGIAWDGMDVGKTASSWGLSMKSLEGLFGEPGIDCNIRAEGNGFVAGASQEFDGDDADFIYVEFADMDKNYVPALYNLDGEVVQESGLSNILMKKKYNDGMVVQVRWQDDNGEAHTMECAMGEGKLLIPVGAGRNWLFNQHGSVSVYVYQDGAEIASPRINDIRFLKVREVD